MEPTIIAERCFLPTGRPTRDIQLWIRESRMRAFRDLLASAARKADTEDAKQLAIEIEEALATSKPCKD